MFVYCNDIIPPQAPLCEVVGASGWGHCVSPPLSPVCPVYPRLSPPLPARGAGQSTVGGPVDCH